MTKNTFYRRVLEHLGVVAAEDVADPADVQLVASRYVSLYAMLVNEKLSVWPIAEDIPDHVEYPLVMLMAAMMVREFGLDPTLFEANHTPAMVMLRRQLAHAYVPHRVEAEYF